MSIMNSEQKAVITKEFKKGIIKELFNQNLITQEQFAKLISMQYKK